MKNWKIWTGVGIAVLAGAGYGIPRYFKSVTGSGAADPTPVRIEKVARGELSEVIQAPGEVRPKTKVSISAKVAARIIEIPHPEGSIVTKGNPAANPPVPASVLVRLDATDLEAALRSTQARFEAQKSQVKVSQARIDSQKSQIEGHRAQLENAQLELSRERELLASKMTSQATYDEAKRKVDEMKASLNSAIHGLEADDSNLTATLHTLEAAEADIAKTREDLKNATIISPIDGTVTKVNAKVGELVMTGTMNNAGTVILEVADLDNMLVIVRVDEADIARVKVGQPAKIRMQAYGDRVFEGTVTSVALSPTEKDKDKNFTAEIALHTKGERIITGLTADADIETSHHNSVLKVPSQAVLGRTVEELPEAVRSQLGEKERLKAAATVVCKFIDGKSVMTPVTVGPSDATHTVITAGLKEGDPVIIGPYKVLEKLTHDQKVKDEKETTATAKAKPGETTGTKP
ncbi:MAG: efflux RND transporter periplasmic adaptor subunit [Candidatus Sumerlaeaceae bacterium]|nr:efflux RND transporter periplasmic adaptor subunit [Candidatus Sumerlaeaceae bacterium]